VVSVVAGGGTLLDVATAYLIVAGIIFALMSPFLLLSFNNAFYRQRLKELLRLADAAPLSAAPPPPA